MAPLEASNAMHAQRLKFHLCTTNSLRPEDQKMEGSATASNCLLRQIGVGTNTKIFSPSDGSIFKCAFPTTNAEAALWRGYEVHRACCLQAASYPNLDVLIPNVEGHITKFNKEFWDKWTSMFPPSESKAFEPGHVVIMEQIPSLPLRVGVSLVELFWGPLFHDTILSDPCDTDFLLRPYLGSRDRLQIPKDKAVMIRDLPLSLDTMHSIGLNPMNYVRPMAQGLALVHWAAHADGRGLEFVLGSPPLRDLPFHPADSLLAKMPKGEPLDTLHLSTVRKRQCHLWMLDFDDCQPMAMDQAGCQAAAQAHWDNEPFLPRPVFNNRNNRADEELWDAFADAYLSMGRRICGPESLLPMLYLDAVIQEGLRRSQHDVDELQDTMESLQSFSLVMPGMPGESKETQYMSYPPSPALVTWSSDGSGVCEEAQPQFWRKR